MCKQLDVALSNQGYNERFLWDGLDNRYKFGILEEFTDCSFWGSEEKNMSYTWLVYKKQEELRQVVC